MRQRLLLLLVVVACVVLVAGCAGPSADEQQPTAAGPTTPSMVLGWSPGSSKGVPLPTASSLAPLNRAAGAAARAGRPTKPVLVNFWASNCVPCVKELPLLQRLQRAGRVTVMGVSQDARRSPAEGMLGRSRVSYANWMDPDGRYVLGFRGSVPIAAVPSSVLVVDGRVARVHIGPFDSWRELVSGLPAAS